MAFYMVERLEDGAAVLEDESGKRVEMKACLLPPAAHEGDVVEEENGVFMVDAEKTRVRREKIQKLQESVFRHE